MQFLTRQHDTWYFRRRVPKPLQERLGIREIYRSLCTSDRRKAKREAALLYVASEELFEVAKKERLSDEELRAIARHWLNDQLELKQKIEKMPPGRLADFEAPSAVPKYRPFIYPDLNGMNKRRHERRRNAHLSSILVNAGYDPTEDRREQLASVLKQFADEYIDQRRKEVFHPDPAPANPVASSANTEPKPSPRFSEKTEEFLEEKSRSTRDHRGYSSQTQAQTRATFRLWLELMEDRPVREYTGEDAAEFRKLILSLPASHGKGAKISAREAIAKAEENGAPLMSMKTAKRHFSTLRQYWTWLRPLGHVGENIFSGHPFPGTKSSKKKRNDWSVEDLQRLFWTRQWRSTAWDSAWRWLPLIALHTGMRLEEICRLRPSVDIVELHDHMCFDIQEHEAPWPRWDPKSEAGERLIPVHSFLLKLGFSDVVEKRRREKSNYLFPELSPSGPDGKLGFAFSREFSRFKANLGIDRMTVFHSFRHSFRTVLENTEFKDSWIDAVMGHEGEDRSEGKTYAKRVNIDKLSQVVEAFESPLDLSFLLKEMPSPSKNQDPQGPHN